MHFTTRTGYLTALAALLATGTFAQEAVDLDAVDSTPAPAPTRHRPGMKVGDVNFSLFFDGYLEYVKSSASGTKPTLAFGQEHNSLLARAATSEGIVVFADVIHPANVFEVTVPFRFLNAGVEGIPGIGNGSIRAGRILVPFGDAAFHSIYGGSVMNSELVKDKFWSDYGASVKLPFGERLETEFYVLNGLQAWGDSSIKIKSTDETNLSKAFGTRIKFRPTATAFVTASYLHDALSTSGDTVWAVSAHIAGLDAGISTGRVSWKVGGMYGRVLSDGFHDYTLDAWYAESRLRLDDNWALRLRGGQADPDSRTRNADDQTDVNASILWQKGPLDVGLTWYHNWQTGAFASKTSSANTDRIRLETYVSL